VAASGSDKEQNYWPGFVDALSNVVLTLVFVLVVFVFALVITSGKLKQKAAQITEQQIEQERTAQMQAGDVQAQINALALSREKLAAELAALREDRDRLREELKKAQANNLQASRGSAEEKDQGNPPSIIEHQVEVVTKAPNKDAAGNTEVPEMESGAAIIITYPRTEVTLNDTAKTNLAKVLEPYRPKLAGAKMVIEAHLGAETYSEARRMAYYRALDLRNFLLDRKLADRETITITTKPNKDAGDGRIELRFVR
jgi:hypothetical protein